MLISVSAQQTVTVLQNGLLHRQVSRADVFMLTLCFLYRSIAVLEVAASKLKLQDEKQLFLFKEI